MPRVIYSCVKETKLDLGCESARQEKEGAVEELTSLLSDNGFEKIGGDGSMAIYRSPTADVLNKSRINPPCNNDYVTLNQVMQAIGPNMPELKKLAVKIKEMYERRGYTSEFLSQSII